MNHETERPFKDLTRTDVRTLSIAYACPTCEQLTKGYFTHYPTSAECEREKQRPCGACISRLRQEADYVAISKGDSPK